MVKNKGKRLCNKWLDAESLNPLMKKSYNQKQIDAVEMSNAESRFELSDIGYKSCGTEVEEEHFPKTFLKLSNGKKSFY